VKRLIAMFVMAVVLSCLLIPVIAAEQERSEIDKIKAREPKGQEMSRRDRITDQSPSLPQTVLDPNEVKSRVEKFEGLKEILEPLGTERKNEEREWLNGPIEERSRLGRLVQQQFLAELEAIRKCAVDEGAAKTVAAVDSILLARRTQFEDVNKKIQLARKRELRQETEEKRTERTGRRTEKSQRGRSRLDRQSRDNTNTRSRDRSRPRRTDEEETD